MLEITTTRANHLVDPSLHVWAWQIPVYLFLGGLVAGMMMIHGWFTFADRHRRAESVSQLLPALGLVLLSAGMGALFLDLEHKLFVWRLYTTFQITSPMSWGAWILIAVYPALFAALLLRVPEPLATRVPVLRAWSAALLADPARVRFVAAANMTLGALLGVYTGILLSTLGARPLWNSALLGPLFLASGLSSAAALVHMVARDGAESELLARADNRLLTAELAILGLFLIGLVTAPRVHQQAAALLLGGPFTAFFWVGVVGLGIAVPLFVQTLAVGRRVRHTAVAPVLVLAGGLLLRFVFVYAGQVSHYGPF
ncbi:MAG: polysulfide reductase NrfD [Candidatus Eisenbacteria bacterium]|uniref:Polysulfide reductase NrfD n=1 Tax=Eiseniibacteriota bacterium TaxID=2212470 RepID=A0A933W236_UNCEI|nr:polysulfide reductase NrfD [Candidatus Eisenbacteria bacterium]